MSLNLKTIYRLDFLFTLKFLCARDHCWESSPTMWADQCKHVGEEHTAVPGSAYSSFQPLPQPRSESPEAVRMFFPVPCTRASQTSTCLSVTADLVNGRVRFSPARGMLMLQALGPHFAVLSLNPASATTAAIPRGPPSAAIGMPLCSPQASGSSHLLFPLSGTVASPPASLKHTSFKPQPNCHSLTLSGLDGVPRPMPLSTRISHHSAPFTAVSSCCLYFPSDCPAGAVLASTGNPRVYLARAWHTVLCVYLLTAVRKLALGKLPL